MNVSKTQKRKCHRLLRSDDETDDESGCHDSTNEVHDRLHASNVCGDEILEENDIFASDNFVSWQTATSFFYPEALF